MTNKNNNGWTPERRARQAQAIRRWSPWTKSTGPKTDTGKAASRYNAYKHGLTSRATLNLRAVMAEHSRWLKRSLAVVRLENARKLAALIKNTQNELMDSPLYGLWKPQFSSTIPPDSCMVRPHE